MKIALVAILAVLMGTTFTSCLKSNSNKTNYAYVTIKSLMGHITLTTDDGYELIPQNASQMTLTDGSIPERAYIAFELFEGETLSSNNTSAKINFIQYYDILYVRYMSEQPVETVTPLLALSENIWSARGYLNVAVAYYTYNGDSSDDFSLYIDKVENNVIYFKLVFTKEVEKTNTYSTKSLSYILPSEEDIKAKHPDLTPDSNGYYKAVLVADGVDQSGSEIELKSNTSEIAFPLSYIYPDLTLDSNGYYRAVLVADGVDQ
jgi:hypothetical protein